MALIVHKYGGTSMGSPERIRNVAAPLVVERQTQRLDDRQRAAERLGLRSDLAALDLAPGRGHAHERAIEHHQHDSVRACAMRATGADVTIG